MAEQATSERNGGAEAAVPAYGRSYYRHDCGVPYGRNEHWLRFFGEVADGIVRDFGPTTVLDAGCAMGLLVEALRERGVEAWGIDVSEYAISQAHESVREHCGVGSLTEPLPRRYDLIVSIEVLEHIAKAEADRAVGNLCAATDRLLLSTSPSDYGEATHLNVQPPEFWSAALAREGFLRDVERDLSYITPWAALYERAEEPLAETVRRYDRSWWRLRHESQELRRALLSANERLAELEERQAEENVPQLQAETRRLAEEVLRLRDHLVARDAELGAAQGQLAQLEDQSRRFTGAAHRVQAKIPGGARLTALLRRLQSRRG
jgi:SAM-dependent methyltransferase